MFLVSCSRYPAGSRWALLCTQQLLGEDEVPSSGCESRLYGSCSCTRYLCVSRTEGLLSQPWQGKANWICSAVLQGHVLQLQTRKGAPICPYHSLGFSALLCLMAGADGGENMIQNLHFYGKRNELG